MPQEEHVGNGQLKDEHPEHAWEHACIRQRMSFAWVRFKLDWQMRGGVILEVMKFAKDTTHSVKYSGIGKPGKVMTESTVREKPKA